MRTPLFLTTLLGTAMAVPAFTIPGIPGFSPTTTVSSVATPPVGPPGVCKPIPANAPAPSPTTRVYNLPIDPVKYTPTEQQFLQSLGFPQGINCAKNLVLFVPGTGVAITAAAFEGMQKSLKQELGSDNVDFITVNLPNQSNGPIDIAAQYVAYAINYSYLYLGRKPTVVVWSQGSIDTQWAFKYWPSTRQTARNAVYESGDLKGTIEATFLCSTGSTFTDPNNGAELAREFTLDGGFGTTVGAIFGAPTFPTQPGQYQAAKLALIAGQAGGPYGGQSLAKRQSLFSPSDPATLTEAGATFLGSLANPVQAALTQYALDPASPAGQIYNNSRQFAKNPSSASIIPTGCLPSVSQQQYYSNLIKALRANNGARNFVPTTSVYSLTDEVVQPQGATGDQNASGYVDGGSDILIQKYCPIIASGAAGQIPPIVSHEGILYSGMGVGAAILAVRNGGQVPIADIAKAYPSSYCSALFQDLTPADVLATESVIPGAGLQILIGTEPYRVATEPAVPAYAYAPPSTYYL